MRLLNLYGGFGQERKIVTVIEVKGMRQSCDTGPSFIERCADDNRISDAQQTALTQRQIASFIQGRQGGITGTTPSITCRPRHRSGVMLKVE